MQFKLNENLITMDDLFQQLDEMSTEDVVNLLDIREKTEIDSSSPMFIFPDGTIVSVTEVAKRCGYTATIHSDFIAIILKELAYFAKYEGNELSDDIDFDDFDESEMLEWMTNELNWVRINCGNSWVESRFYCVLPPSMTSAQFRSLEKWLEWGYDNNKGEVLILCAEVGKNHVYSFEDNFPEEIIKKIKRFYSSGEFYEKLSRKCFTESNEYRRFYGKRIDKVTNDRGTKKEYKHKRDILEKRYRKRFVVHHANGLHSENAEDNIYLLPEELHNKLFDEAVNMIESEDKESGLHDKKMHGIYAAYKSILTMIRHFNKKYENEGIGLPEITLPKSVQINGESSFEEIDAYRQSRLSDALTDVLLRWKSDPTKLIFKVSEVEEDNLN